MICHGEELPIALSDNLRELQGGYDEGESLG